MTIRRHQAFRGRKALNIVTSSPPRHVLATALYKTRKCPSAIESASMLEEVSNLHSHKSAHRKSTKVVMERATPMDLDCRLAKLLKASRRHVFHTRRAPSGTTLPCTNGPLLWWGTDTIPQLSSCSTLSGTAFHSDTTSGASKHNSHPMSHVYKNPQ